MKNLLLILAIILSGCTKKELTPEDIYKLMEKRIDLYIKLDKKAFEYRNEKDLKANLSDFKERIAKKKLNKVKPYIPNYNRVKDKINIVFYQDPINIGSKYGFDVIQKLKEKYKNKINITHKFIPQSAESTKLALLYKAIVETNPREGYFFLEGIYERQALFKSNQDELVKVFLDHAFDPPEIPRINQLIKDKTIKNRLLHDKNEAKSFKIVKDPSFIISNIIFREEINFKNIEYFIDNYIIKAK